MTYDADNRLVTYNGRAVEYDDDGNMTYGPLNGEMADFTYDCRNRLTQVTTETGETTTYTYDAENNRIEQMTGDTKTVYVNDPEAAYSQLLQKTEYTKNIFGLYMAKTAETLYTYGAGLTSETKAEGTYYYHFNNIGSTTEITDAAGAVKYRITYGPYGELTGITDENQNPVNIADEAITPFLYNGQLGVQTDQNGLYYMRARYYNTDIKRFINRDTVSGDLTNSQSLNKYSYVQGNPVSQTDPFGLSPMGGDIMSILSQLGHTALDIGGFFWDGFDLINAAWYYAEENYLMAASCFVAAIPFMGSVASKGVSKIAYKVLKNADKVDDFIKAAKISKTAGYINDISKLAGYTGMTALGAMNTVQAYKVYKDARANGEDATLELCSVILNGAFTAVSGIRAVSSATKVTARLKADSVGDAVKAAAKDNMSGNKGSSGKGGSAGEGGGKKTLKDGEMRAAEYSSGWGDASLKESIDKFAPGAEPTFNPEKGKIMYTNPETGISVVYDEKGNYFRIQDTTRSGRRNYLDLNGNDINNEVVNGKTRGRSNPDYQRVTHFNNID